MKIIILTILLGLQSLVSISQNCSSINLKIDTDFSFVNELEGLEMPLNKSWDIVIQNQKAIIVFLKNDTEQASAGIINNKNKTHLNSAHEINKSLALQFLKQMGIGYSDVVISDVEVKNIPAKQVEYNYAINNLGDTYLMSGLLYMLVKDESTFIFMFNCQRNLNKCYKPFFKNVIKSTYFSQDWY